MSEKTIPFGLKWYQNFACVTETTQLFWPKEIIQALDFHSNVFSLVLRSKSLLNITDATL